MSSELDQYDYELPDDLIAQYPLAERVDARLLAVHRGTGSFTHRHIRDLPTLLEAGDCLVINDTRVVPARLFGYRTETGGRWEGLFLSGDGEGNWRLLAKCRGKMHAGEPITLVDQLGADDTRLWLLEKQDDGVWLARADTEEEAFTLLDRIGRVPLPHYIRGGNMVETDRSRYQTVYADHPGSAAAPTAGLHFTNVLLEQLERRGISTCRVTLHVGLDTFRPINVASLGEHRMHSEWCHIDHAAVEQLAACRSAGGRIVAVGTTAVRVLETAAAGGELQPWSGQTDLFIRPGHRFRAVDALLTNFHLPRSTLLVLVRTFGGDELIRRAYETAIREQYRFYSYGDAMLIE